MNPDIDQTLARYAELVRACPHNLLSPRGLQELETRHIAESLAFASTLPADVELLDVGPGGGLPGMVIAIARPDIQVTMVEATGKKATFLAESAAELGIDVDVVNGRVEELARGRLAEAFDVATARAVSSLDNLVTWILPTLRPAGQLWAIKGERWEQELRDARSAIERAGAEVVSTPASTTDVSTAPAAPAVVIIGRARGR